MSYDPAPKTPWLGLDTAQEAVISLHIALWETEIGEGHTSSRPHPVLLPAPGSSWPHPVYIQEIRQMTGACCICMPRPSMPIGRAPEAWRRATPVLGVYDGINDGVVDGRGLGDDSWH